MREELLPAIQESVPWLDHFNRRGYSAAFQAYMDRYAPLFRKALREGDRSGTADALVEAVAEGRKKARFWTRSARAFAEKQMLVAYLSPMLIEIGEAAFAEELCQAWARRWPKDAYRTASFKKIRNGFRDTILGFEIPRRRDEDDDE